MYLGGYSIPSLFTKHLNAGESIKMDSGKGGKKIHELILGRLQREECYQKERAIKHKAIFFPRAQPLSIIV